MKHITKANLESAVARLNTVLKTNEDNEFFVSYEYGTSSLRKISPIGGRTNVLIGLTKRELFAQITSMLMGVSFAQAEMQDK